MSPHENRVLKHLNITWIPKISYGLPNLWSFGNPLDSLGKILIWQPEPPIKFSGGTANYEYTSSVKWTTGSLPVRVRCRMSFMFKVLSRVCLSHCCAVCSMGYIQRAKYGMYFVSSGGHFKNTYKLLNIRGLKNSILYKNCIFQCVGKIFCVEFQSCPLKFHIKYLAHTLKGVYFIRWWKFKSS